MKRFVAYIALTAIVGACFVSCTETGRVMPANEVLLSEGWLVQSSEKVSQTGEELSVGSGITGVWYDAAVPSTIMGVLTAHNEYKDLLFGMNYKDTGRSRFDVSWWYVISFNAPPRVGGGYTQLIFDGISYRANIWLNGKQIASKDETYGTFCRFSFDVTGYLQEENILAVEVFRAREGEPNSGFVDWNPRPLDENMGIFREVRLVTTGGVEMNHTWVKSDINKETLDEAWLTIETQVANLSDKEVKGNIEGEIENIAFQIPVMLEPGERRTVKITPNDVKGLHIKNPRLWWCNNMGSPELYDLNLRFVTGDGVSAKEDVTFGIRTIETYTTGQGHKGFILNGKKVLVKSAGWTDDIFLRDTPEGNEVQVQYVKDMNLNAIRFENIWGTSQNIYDLCDRYGLMALVGWSCQWEWEGYFGRPNGEFGCIQSEHDMDLLVRYFNDQVRWLRNHPAIIAWYGGSDMLLNPTLEKRYMELLPQIDNRPYVGCASNRTSAITGPTGMKMEGPYEYVGPNYWFEDKFGGNYGFNTETGPGAQVPVYESLLKMIPEDKLWPVNEYWDYHCTTSTTALNNMKPNTEAIEAMYGKAEGLHQYLNHSYLANLQSTKSMFEAFRVNPEEATGIVQWMLNSAWPSMYWQLYDYFKIPVAAYYGVKKANKPIQLIYNYKDNGVYAVNETGLAAEDVTIIIRGLATNSNVLFDGKKTLTLAPNSVQNIYTVDNSAKNTFLSLVVRDSNGNELADNFYCLSSKEDRYAWDKTMWVGTPILEYGDFKDLSKLPVTDVQVKVTPLKGKGISVELENTSATIALLTQLALTDGNKEIAYPVFWSDNYVSILPGEKKVLECTYTGNHLNTSPTSLKITGWNLKEQKIALK
ncbi:MAG: glycoside hydrolase family 2 [Tannerellaceae bacterium]|jgi:exo-1,4-beta-D-glucosaminidase|nr:glycoside hydrolase family 2 [Tannerellaceae bacterium]